MRCRWQGTRRQSSQLEPSCITRANGDPAFRAEQVLADIDHERGCWLRSVTHLRCPDDGSLGCRARAGGDQAGSRAVGADRARQRRGHRPMRVDTTVAETDNPSSDRQHPAGRWRSRVDAYHVQDHKDCGDGRDEAARPEP
jgi:hypothetical protein